jgi:transcriptional regulator with XRE-family HTH domain
MDKKSGFPSRLASLRKWRGLSQLQLANSAGCSQRHISFLELGRTQPSREMLQRLSVALGLSFRQSNDLLLAAGFAPIWSETPFNAETLAPIRQALDYMLKQQEPYPAVVVDRRWNLLQSNKGAVAMMEFLVGPLAPGAKRRG